MKSQITTSIFCLIFAFAKAQSVSTITQGNFYDGLAITSNGDIYCSNFIADQVFKYEFTSGAVTTFATGFVSPNGIGVDSNDNIYVCEAGAGRITVLDALGAQINQFTGLNNPTGIKYDAHNNRMLWVSYNLSALYELDLGTGESVVIFQGSPLNGPSGIAFIGNDTFISNYEDRKIFKLESDDSLTEVAQLPSEAAQNNVLGFLTAKGNFLYGTQIGEHRIYRIDPSSGEISLFSGSEVGSNDGSLEEATYNFPNGIIGDNINDRIYISDAGTSNLRVIENVSLSIDETDALNARFSVFPNPVGDTLIIEATFQNPMKFALKVVNSLGQVVTESASDIKQKEIEIKMNTAGWSKGTYIVQMTTSNGTLTRKIIK